MLRVGRTRRRVLPGEPEQLDRLGSVAGVEVIPGGLEPSLAQPLGVLIGRSLQCELRELCGCIRRATRASVPRRFVEFGGDLCIGTDRRERQVPSTFLRDRRRARRAADGAPAGREGEAAAYTVDPSSGCENLTRSPVRSMTPAASAAVRP
jgi:hypothetical protein